MISDLISNFVCWVKTGIVVALNFITGGIESLAQAALDLLPAMDDAPDFANTTLPGGAGSEYDLGTVLGWINYVFPMNVFLGTYTLVLTVIVGWWFIQIPLRWLRAVE